MKKIILLILLITLYCFVSAQYCIDYKSGKKRSSGIQRTASKSSVLMDKYDVKFYKLDIKAERTTTYVEGNVLINAKIIALQLDTFVFELKDYMNIDSVYINNQKRSFNRYGDDVFVGIIPLNRDSLISAKIYYNGVAPNTGNFFSGISSQVDPTWGNQITWTLSESFAAKEWFPVKQSLKDKADSTYIFVTTSNENKVGSEGILSAIVQLPDNKVRYEWKTRYPIDYYLISIAIGKYVDYSIYAHPLGMQDSILIQNYIYDNPQTLPFHKTEIDRTIDFINLYSDLFGIYPFYKEKYGHSLTPLAGGMEHQTMTTLGDFNFYLTCHELSHQWWGNNITCASWSDIWINEGFASYAEYLAANYLLSYQDAQQHMQTFHTHVMAQPDGSVYIPVLQAVTDNRIFDGRLSYEKGASIIHNLRFEIGNDSVFFHILKTVQNRFKDSTISGLDFKAIAEELSGKNFSDFFNQWYFGEGFPTLNLVYFQQNDTLYLNINQQTSTTVTPLFKLNMEYKIKFLTGDTIIKLYHQSNAETYKIPVQQTVTGIEVDPNNWVINGIGSINHILENKVLNYLIFPNPVQDNLEVYFGNNKRTLYLISVYDITAKKILSFHASSDDHLKINIQDLEKGIYFLQISDGEDKTVQKFIKN